MVHFLTDATYPPEQLIVGKHPVLSVESGTASVVGVVTYLIQGVNPRGTGDPQRGSVWMKGGIVSRVLSEVVVVALVFVLTVVSSGYRSHDKKKSHKYDSSKSRMRRKTSGREKEAGGGTRRAGSRVTSQRPPRSHSDDEEDEGVPASYHTVSLQVSQDVSTTALFPPLPGAGVSGASQNLLDRLQQVWQWPPDASEMLAVV